jgi:hypothetical protein
VVVFTLVASTTGSGASSLGAAFATRPLPAVLDFATAIGLTGASLGPALLRCERGGILRCDVCAWEEIIHERRA